MLHIEDLCFRHPNTCENVLEGIGLVARAGEVTTLLGPNGSGKTTLFRCIAGIWKNAKGSVRFDGKELTGLPPEKRARILAVVPQDHDPPFPYSVYDVVLMGRVAHVSLFSTPTRNDCKYVEEALDAVGISHLRERPYTKISGGERQLVLIARALAQETPLLLLDEPITHLDFRNQILVLKKVREIMGKKGLTVCMTLHDPNLAMLFSDHVAMMNGGRIVGSGTPSEVITIESMKRIYGIDVCIFTYNGHKVISPAVI